MPSTVTINCDLGESYGILRTGDDEGIAPSIHLANLACGFHGGDPATMGHAVRLAIKHGLKIGAHPSLPDIAGFGRREIKMSRDDLRDTFIYQIGALEGFLKAHGAALHHVKLHGVVYKMANDNEDYAEATCDAVAPFGVSLVGTADSLLERVAQRRKIPFLTEFFADLEVDDGGKVLSVKERYRTVDMDWLTERVKTALTEGIVKSRNGKPIPIRFQSIGVHLDTRNAAEVAARVRALVDAA